MRKLFLFLLVFINLNANQIEDPFVEELKSMNQKQLDIINKAYHLAKIYDFGYTLASIAWQESMGGIAKVNINDPSFGVFHNLITSVDMKLKEDYSSNIDKNILADMLYHDFYFAANMAIDELNLWKTQHKNDWYKTVASYNRGGKWWNGKKYADNIRKRIKILKENKKIWYKENWYNRFYIQNKHIKISNNFFKKDLKEQFESFNMEDMENLLDLYVKGARNNVGRTITAISWYKTGFGELRFDMKNKSYGYVPTPIYELYRLNTNFKYNNYFSINLLAQRLINNKELSITSSIKLLKYNIKYTGDYHAGVRKFLKYNTNDYKNIKKIVDFLKPLQYNYTIDELDKIVKNNDFKEMEIIKEKLIKYNTKRKLSYFN